MSAKPPLANTRQQLIHAAMELFARKGYGSTSVADILHAAGAGSGSLYHFFPGKQDLLLAVLDTYHEGIHRMLLEPAWRGVDDPIERVFALLDFYREALVATEFRYGCPIGNLALEIHDPDPPVRERLAANFSAWSRAVADCFREASGRFPPDTGPEALAVFVLTTMEGGVMLSRVHESLEPFDASVRQLRDHIERLTAADPNTETVTSRETNQ